MKDNYLVILGKIIPFRVARGQVRDQMLHYEWPVASTNPQLSAEGFFVEARLALT